MTYLLLIEQGTDLIIGITIIGKWSIAAYSTCGGGFGMFGQTKRPPEPHIHNAAVTTRSKRYIPTADDL